jgi:hypothetical protein
MQERLHHMQHMPTLVCLGTADDAVPPAINMDAHLKRICRAMGPAAHAVLFRGGNHDFEGCEEQICSLVADYIRKDCEIPESVSDFENVCLVE